ncbi:G-protein coupled receptor Mth2-like [Bradysia coprophila]|uniref:G-protein coupled receptor Mth2-like n=1 Tax=Bradysia coprophila TaxID=38358 RepID=UPI00187DA9E4|nr:G-protein coupled receptor Mth2-like [Bradysia coprophila]
MARHHETVFAILLIIVTKSNADLDNLNVPCKYLDSINITNGIRNTDDDSIMFEGISYPKTLHATYDYAFINESYRQREAPHERGCICAMDPLKPCVRMCCPRGQYLTPGLNGSSCAKNENVFNMSVTVSDGERFSEGNIFDFFNYVVGKPCAGINKMEPAERQEDVWVLLKNGTILRGDPIIETLDKNKYCFTAMVGSNDTFETTLLTCFKEPDRTRDYWVLCGMFISVPFLVATIIVYTILPELRNVHGKSLVSYLCALVVGYVTLALIKLNGSTYIEPVLCRTIGYITYFAFLSAFFWLNVISFDLWRNFCGIHSRRSNTHDLKKFVYFSLYAWGSTMLMVAICIAMDNSPSVPTDFQPAIGIRECFLGTSRWSQLLYLYLPIMMIMTSNLIFFVLTSWKIRKVQMEVEKMTNKADSKIHRKNLDKERANHGLFMRLFIVMGVTWSMEPISWIISPEGTYFYPTDVMNAIQGVIIFFLFVLRARVKQLMVKRWQIWRGKLQSKRSVTTTRNSATGVTIMDDNNHTDVEMTSNN